MNENKTGGTTHCTGLVRKALSNLGVSDNFGYVERTFLVKYAVLSSSQNWVDDEEDAAATFASVMVA